MFYLFIIHFLFLLIFVIVICCSYVNNKHFVDLELKILATPLTQFTTRLP